MPYYFEEIMNYHHNNRVVYEEIKKNLPRLVPFVGAGLTQFAYWSWPMALKEMAKNIVGKDNIRLINSKLKEKNNNNHLIEAAQMLEDFRGTANLACDIAHLFSIDRLNAKQDMIDKEAISLLPFLFPGLVLTTNFDQALERVYEIHGHPFQAILHPGHSELLNQFLRQAGNGGLFKLHGTINCDLIEYSHIVFTEKQYELHYGDNAPLPRELKKCFKQKLMLFLGCSLNQDRTMELLQKIVEPGEIHYTFFGCAKPDRDQKIKELGAKNIRAILYEKGHHEAVRVLLEHLLEETQPDIYRTLPYYAGALKSTNLPLSDRFNYRSEIVPLIGREKELQQLNNFLDNPNVPFVWWAITGPGGSGKSRLAYEFQKHLPSGWTSHYLNSEDYKDLSGLTDTLTKKTLLIADYVQEHARQLGEWMEELNGRMRSLPLRLLLVERENDDKSQGLTWTNQLYSNVRHKQSLKQRCFQPTFLYLRPLSDGDLLSIIGHYVSAVRSGDLKLAEEEKHFLLQKLKIVDSDFIRPLYAMFITDAYIDGENPLQWNREEILDYVIGREHDRLDFSIRHIMGLKRQDGKLFSACQYLQCAATVLQGASVQRLRAYFPDVWEIFNEKSEYFKAPEDMLMQIGLVAENRIPSLTPDVVGEYFVYKWLCNQSGKIIHCFLTEVWKKPESTFVFFNRLIWDYKDLINSEKQWVILLPSNLPLSKETITFYAELMANATSLCNAPIQIGEFVNFLDQLNNTYPDNQIIADAFAISLSNYGVLQNDKGRQRIESKLNSLVDSYPNSSSIVIVVANYLINLIGRQTEKEALKTIEHLQSYVTTYPTISELASLLSVGLLELSSKQDILGIMNTGQQLEDLLLYHPNIWIVAINLSRCLFRLSSKQDRSNMQKTLQRLENLARDYPMIPEVSAEFAKALLNNSLGQNDSVIQETAEKISLLAESFPYSLDIVVCLAKSLANLCAHEDKQKARNTITTLSGLASTYPIPEIAVELAHGLFNLSCKQKTSSMQKIAKRIESLVMAYPSEPQIVDYYARVLVNLSAKQPRVKRKESIQLLQNLSITYPDMLSVTIKYAMGLSNLSFKENIEEMQETVKQLQQLVNRHPGVSELSIHFACALANLSYKQSKNDLQKTLILLEQLNATYRDIPELSEYFACGLLNMIHLQDEREVQENIQKLSQLIKNSLNASKIAVIYAHALNYLCTIQDEQRTLETIQELEQLLTIYPREWKIVAVLAVSLWSLKGKQAPENALKTEQKLTQLFIDHPVLSKVQLRIGNKSIDMRIMPEK